MAVYTRQQISDEVLSRQDGAVDGKVLREVRPFIGGALYVVGFTGNDGKPYENFVHEKDGDLHIYRMPYELFHGISKEAEKQSAWSSIIHASATEGIIAIILVLTICFLAIKGAVIPEILGSALTAVLGFYFGSKVGNGKRNSA